MPIGVIAYFSSPVHVENESTRSYCHFPANRISSVVCGFSSLQVRANAFWYSNFEEALNAIVVVAQFHQALFGLAAQNCGPLLIVAHAGGIRVLLSRILHRPLQRLLEIPQDYGAVTILRTGAPAVELVAINVLCRIPSPLPSS